MKVILKLYISGVSPISVSALGNLRKVLDKEKVNHTLEVIDVIENPEALEKHNVITTPLLEKLEPRPTKRFTGDLICDKNILSKLDLEKTEIGI